MPAYIRRNRIVFPSSYKEQAVLRSLLLLLLLCFVCLLFFGVCVFVCWFLFVCFVCCCCCFGASCESACYETNAPCLLQPSESTETVLSHSDLWRKKQLTIKYNSYMGLNKGEGVAEWLRQVLRGVGGLSV